MDIQNYIPRGESWDIYNLNSPQRSEKRVANLDPLSVFIKATESSMDGFIDNIVTVTVDDKHWIELAKIAVLLVICTLFRPLQPSEPLKQDDPISLRKLAGEIKLDYHKTCLGGYIHTHSLVVFLPKEKKIAWATDIK